MKYLATGLFFIAFFAAFVAADAQTKRTLYDKNGKKVIEYTFVRDITTDCSVPQAVNDALKNEVSFYNALFSSACEKHDYGYSQAPWQKAGFSGTSGKRIADERFRVDMIKACDARFPNLLDAPRKAACYSAAEIYFSAVYHYNDANWQKKQTGFTNDKTLVVTYSSAPGWEKTGTIVKASRASVYGVNKNDNIYYWNGNGGWVKMDGLLKDISIGSDGTIWGVNSNDDIYKRQNNRWVKVDGKLKQISVGNNTNVWGVNSGENIYKRVGNGWKQIAGSLKHVSTAADGSVWGVNRNDNIYRWNGSGWTQIPGKLKMISVGSKSQVWGVNSNENVYRWNGRGWDKMPGLLKNVSVANDGTVWGVNKNDNIYKWNGRSWDKTNGLLKDLEVRNK